MLLKLIRLNIYECTANKLILFSSCRLCGFFVCGRIWKYMSIFLLLKLNTKINILAERMFIEQVKLVYRNLSARWMALDSVVVAVLLVSLQLALLAPQSLDLDSIWSKRPAPLMVQTMKQPELRPTYFRNILDSQRRLQLQWEIQAMELCASSPRSPRSVNWNGTMGELLNRELTLV